MAVNTESAIAWFQARKGKVTYSMAHRTGPSSYDCSSAIYYALCSGGAKDIGYPINTESEHAWLIENGYSLIAENKDWDMQRGDVIIWGVKGQSAGAGGHTMLALNDKDVIHCTAAVNGITENDYNQLYSWNAGSLGGPYTYVYRSASKNETTNEKIIKKKVGTEMLALVIIKDDFGGHFKKDRIFFWNSMTGFKYIETPGTVDYLKAMYKRQFGDNIEILESRKKSPHHSRLAEINPSVDLDK